MAEAGMHDLKIRRPAVAGRFYAADAHRLRTTVSAMLGEVPTPDTIAPKALIAPHAGYVYSGHVAAAAFATLRHALEVELPFLQSVLPAFTLVPLLIGDATAQEVAAVLRRLWGGGETLIVVSSDLSHFLDYDTARRRDAATAAGIERGDWNSLGPDQACGFLGVAGLLLEAGRRDLAAKRLSLCNSADTAGSRDRVVGYGAWLFAQAERSM